MKRTLLAAASLLACLFRVARVSNLMYRRFPIGRAFAISPANENSQDSQAGSTAIQQVGNLRYSISSPPDKDLLAALSLVRAEIIAQWKFNSLPPGNHATTGMANPSRVTGAAPLAG